MREVAVVTSSCACIPDEFAREHHIHVVPFTLIIGNRTFRDGIDITTGEFYGALERDYSTVSTSAPSVGDYLEVFRTLESRGSCSSVVCITIASGISTSYAAARNAATKIDSMKIEVVDSQTAATGQAWVAMEAARIAERGGDLAAVIGGVRKVSSRVKVLGAVETLDYLKRSGRVNAVSAFAADRLNIKPVFLFQHGEARPLAKTRSKRRAFEKIARVAADTYREFGPLHLSVFHATALQEALELDSILKGEVECSESFLAEFTPVMGKHTGPGLVGAGFF